MLLLQGISYIKQPFYYNRYAIYMNIYMHILLFFYHKNYWFYFNQLRELKIIKEQILQLLKSILQKKTLKIYIFPMKNMVFEIFCFFLYIMTPLKYSIRKDTTFEIYSFSNQEHACMPMFYQYVHSCGKSAGGSWWLSADVSTMYGGPLLARVDELLFLLLLFLFFMDTNKASIWYII